MGSRTASGKLAGFESTESDPRGVVASCCFETRSTGLVTVKVVSIALQQHFSISFTCFPSTPQTLQSVRSRNNVTKAKRCRRFTRSHSCCCRPPIARLLVSLRLRAGVACVSCSLPLLHRRHRLRCTSCITTSGPHTHTHAERWRSEELPTTLTLLPRDRLRSSHRAL